jgi:ubiquinone/menaquinone biosynthesis C-methylase UbiE
MTKDRVLAFGVEPSDAKYRLRLARYVDLADRLERLAANRPAESPALRVLDVGCGKGRLRAFCGEGAAQFDWHGLDFQDWRLARAKEAGGYMLVQGDLCRGLPYTDGTFDAVVCSQVLEHLDDLTVPLAEMHRVLRPGGTLFLSLPTFPPLVAGAATAVLSVLRRRESFRRKWKGHVRFFSTFAIRGLLRSYALRELSGQRLLSVKALENSRLFYRLNRFLADLLPFLAVEVTAEATKPEEE